VASKKKKKSTLQTAAALATMGMPAPVQQIASSKIGSLVMIVGGLILVATGAITISWQGGLPSVKVNEARAEQLKQEVQQRARVAADRVVSEWGPATTR
jgi:hypothetical protein